AVIGHAARQAGVHVAYRAVRASRGKSVRAEPVAAMFGNPPARPSKVHLVGGFPELEDQLCTWVPGDDDSPDRLDAMVWAVTDLMQGRTVEFPDEPATRRDRGSLTAGLMS